MLEVIETIYKGGVFVPEKTFDLPEGTRIKIVIETFDPKVEQQSNVQEPTVTDPTERKKVLEKLFKSWDENPIPDDAPRKFKREELYERD